MGGMEQRLVLRKGWLLLVLTVWLTPLSVLAQFTSQAAPADAELYFISPKNGETLSGEILVQFGLKGFGVAPAGTQHPAAGHHHLLVDLDTVPPMNQPMPASEHIRHFGGGQTEAAITLPKGVHTLQLILGDHLHVPYAPPILSEKITITVK